uniref:NADH dehydrogenase [ubiquinone] iron-sulfur protein 5 n=1 Tax=Globisporangium ultimum (strain ATCC 200006 / CBS 805.95 / DAOM BR144) TaxID=431595 RepID=K3X7I5_GLOUD
MSSGFGFKGREGRCYRFWKDIEECSKNTEFTGQCGKQVEDYLECLHHKKELTRMNAIVVQKEKQEAAARHGGGGHDDGHGH